MTDTTSAPRIDRPVELAYAATGLGAVFFALVGLLIVAGFIPPQDPSAGADEIAEFYRDNAGGIRTGMIMAMIGFSLFVPFGVSVAVQLRDGEPRPLLSWVLVASCAVAALEGVMASFIWATAAFRPDDVGVEITRMLNDLGWFAFLFDIPPFMIWIGTIGVAILRDRRTEPPFPRWAGYLNLWVAVLIIPGMAMVYVKTGPLAWDGVVALYIPFGVFFIWMLTMSPLLFRAINREADRTD